MRHLFQFCLIGSLLGATIGALSMMSPAHDSRGQIDPADGYRTTLEIIAAQGNVDAWGHPLQISITGDVRLTTSAGPDGIFQTQDDLAIPSSIVSSD